MSRPRIRSIKPEMWQDEDFGLLDPEAQLLFIGLISHADDHGRFKGSAMRVRVRDTFSYFCGICWNIYRERQTIAADIIEQGGADGAT